MLEVSCVCFIFFFRDILDNIPHKNVYLDNFQTCGIFN